MPRSEPLAPLWPDTADVYTTPAGDRVEARPVGERGGVTLYDIETLRDGEIVDYFEDIPGWQLTLLATRNGWKPDAR